MRDPVQQTVGQRSHQPGGFPGPGKFDFLPGLLIVPGGLPSRQGRGRFGQAPSGHQPPDDLDLGWPGGLSGPNFPSRVPGRGLSRDLPGCILEMLPLLRETVIHGPP